MRLKKMVAELDRAFLKLEPKLKTKDKNMLAAGLTAAIHEAEILDLKDIIGALRKLLMDIENR